MNRICQSSFGNLEAVISFAGSLGSPKRNLVHFYRDHLTGKWEATDTISSEALSGGSIIQNRNKCMKGQEHGDFDVLVLEEDGYMAHYRRDNYRTYNNKNAWYNHAFVNDEKHPIFGQILVCGVAPLLQSDTPGNEAALETVLLTTTGEAMHYRCYTHEKFGELWWHWPSKITGGVKGATCLFQSSKDHMNALVPRANGITEFTYTFADNIWTQTHHIGAVRGPACTYTPNPAHPITHVIFNGPHHVFMTIKAKGVSTPMWYSLSQVPAPLRQILSSPYRKGYSGHLMSIVPHPVKARKNAPNIEAIVFHRCGTGKKDTWMILQWSRLMDSAEWVISGVVKDYVDGCPM
ncbi:hypothetical protein F4821DRAFT_49439 [Hypoxylon rubiginosum]|uniref:Uncharacterized protein n=1 Tax=Hypoxylon rubiginosum TaxID=110542 RepID=A0ACC0CK21_9PEZI|nr:hypothetical protein F4821DRAFT_49439 [Hypoxylon rubiginosum]